MQTFLPYAGFDASAAVLDDSRLGKQRVETLQILRALVFPSYKGWKNHPATRMWRGFTEALVSYGIAMCDEWERRGRADAVRRSLLEFAGGSARTQDELRVAGRLPLWIGLPDLHVSHRAALARKLPEHYRSYFREVDDAAPYHWPAPLFPRWPVRRDRPLTEEEAVEALGLAGAPEDARTAALVRVLEVEGPTLWVRGGPYDAGAPPVDELRPPVIDRPPGKVSESIARPPTPEDEASVRAEVATAPLLLAYPEALLDNKAVRAALPKQPRLVVLDGVSRRRRFPGADVVLLEPGQ